MRCVVLILALLAAVLAEAQQIAPGKEGRFAVSGSQLPRLLYVPTDHKRGAKLPLILFMPGFGGKPSNWLFRRATGGRGYLLCALSYGALSGLAAKGIPGDAASTKTMIQFIERVRRKIDQAYGVSQSEVFLAGFSMGGGGSTDTAFIPMQELGVDSPERGAAGELGSLLSSWRRFPFALRKVAD